MVKCPRCEKELTYVINPQGGHATINYKLDKDGLTFIDIEEFVHDDDQFSSVDCYCPYCNVELEGQIVDEVLVVK